MQMVDKENIRSHCIELLELRISHAKKAMEEAQEASASEEKSSAGDKYETARAMGHLSGEMNAKQWQKAVDELKLARKLDIKFHPSIRVGSLVYTETSIYFIGIGLGPIMIDGVEIITLSLHAPLTKLLLGKSIGSSIDFNNHNQVIQKIL